MNVQLAGKQVIVVGLGSSGIAAAELCLSQGAKVLGTDVNSLAQLSSAAKLLPITFVTGGHAGVDFESGGSRCRILQGFVNSGIVTCGGSGR